MKKRLPWLLAMVLLLTMLLPVYAMADGGKVYQEGERGIWLPEGETPDLPVVENCQWVLTQETQTGPWLSCALPEHSHVENCAAGEDGVYLCGHHVQHDESCLETVYPDCAEHVHDENCVTKTIYDCGQEENPGHSHGETCYERTCGKEEGEDAHMGCPHTMEPACGKTEHTHEEGCYGMVLDCGYSYEHTHSDSCNSSERNCGEEHEHLEGCYITKTCGYDSEHQHTDSCYKAEVTCDVQEHAHSEACDQPNYASCPIPESNQHTESCYVLICGKNVGDGSHSHEACAVVETQYLCGQEAHSHTEACKTEQRCTLGELEPHVTEGCQPGCALEAHAHGEGCYTDMTLCEWGVALIPAPIIIPEVREITLTVAYADEADNVPLSGATVTLTQTDLEEGSTPAVLTGTAGTEPGTYMFQNVPIGSYIPALTYQDETKFYTCDPTPLTIAEDTQSLSLTAIGTNLQSKLTIQRAVVRKLNGVDQREDYRFPGYDEGIKYEITWTAPDDAQQTQVHTIDLSDRNDENDKITVTIPYGCRYQVTEESGPFETDVTKFEGIIQGEDVTLTAHNTYRFYTADGDHSDNTLRDTLCLQAWVTDPAGNPLKKAGIELTSDGTFTADANGLHHICFSQPGTYYMKQSKVPEGYTGDLSHYKIVVKKNLEEETENGKPVIREKLSMDTEASSLPKLVSGIYTIENTVKLVDVKVTVRWRTLGVSKPASVKVGLYQDGKLMDTVDLNANRKWTYTWEDLPATSEYEVDELNLPDHFHKTIRQTVTNHFTISNSAFTIPKTEDAFPLDQWITGLTISGAMLASIAYLIWRKRKEEKA